MVTELSFGNHFYLWATNSPALDLLNLGNYEK